MEQILKFIKTKRYYILGFILVLLLVLLLASQSQPSAAPLTADDFKSTGANLSDDTEILAVNTQIDTLENLAPYENGYFRVEVTNDIPLFKVTLFKGYEESKKNFIDWLSSQSLDKLSISHFTFVVQE